MLDARHDLPLCRTVAGKLVGDHDARRPALLLQQLAEQAVGGPFVPPALHQNGDRREIGGATAVGYFRPRSLTEGGYVAWVLRLVEIGAEGEGPYADVVEISRPDGLVDIADLGLTLAEAKLVLAGVQREIVAAQARDHAVRRPGCRHCAGVCRVKDYRQHAIATLFGQVAVRLPRFRCAGCGTTGTGVQWPP